MAQSLTMPKLGLTMSEGTISKWNKKIGDKVTKGDVVFTVATDKLTYEFQAESDGVLLKITVPDGSSASVGAEVGLIGAAGEKVEATPVAAPKAEAPAADRTASPAAAKAPAKGKKVVVIGGGPGGYVCAIRLAQLGASVTLVEKEVVGGTCLNVGCIPTKVLVQAADVLTTMRNCGAFGLKCTAPTFDWAAIQARKDAVVGQLTGGVAGLLQANGVAIVAGEAKFTSATTIDVGGKSISVDAFVIAAGSVPVVPPIPGIHHPNIVTSTEALSFHKVPKSLLIVGGGVIGMEFAGVYATLGTKITIVEMMPVILPTTDQELVGIIRKRLEAQGVEFHTSCKVTGFKGSDDGVTVSVEAPDGPKEFKAEKVLLSIGRKANTAALALDKIGMQMNRAKIVVDKKMETSIPGIYAIGDCCSPIMLAHVASTEGEVAAENIMGADREMDYKTVPFCVFTAPEIAWAGLTEKEARDKGYDVKIGKFPLLGNGKCLIMNETDGMIKFVVDGHYNEILGVHIIGPHASDLVLEAALALRLECTVDELITTIHGHPTIGEALGEAVRAVNKCAIHVPPAK